MQANNSVYPSEEQLQGFTEPGVDGPVNMVNLLRYKARAEYPDVHSSHPTGEEACAIYSKGVSRLLKDLGGGLIFAADVERLMLGEVEELRHKIAIAMYPSRAAMLELMSAPPVQDIGPQKPPDLQASSTLKPSVPSAHG